IPNNELYEKLDQIQAGTLNPADDTSIVYVLEKAEISPKDFLAWVVENFPGIKQVITLHEPNAECNLENTELRTIGALYEDVNEGIPDKFFILLHRFLRLWRKVGWSIPDLDLVLMGLNAEDLNADVLGKVYFIQKTQKALKTPLAQLMSLWSTLDLMG